MEFKESLPEKIEDAPFETDLKVDFIRHGKPKYTEEEIKSAEVEGNLTEEGIEQIKERALELAGKIDKESELVVFWVSPKRRAQQTAEILFNVFKEQGFSVIKDLKTVESLSDAKMTPKFIENLRNSGSRKWMKYWTESDLPEGTETPKEVRERVERVITYLERIARTITLPEGKRLHFICVGHEEIFMDLLGEGYGLGIESGAGPTYGEIMSMDIKKSKEGRNATLQMKYRGQKTHLNFDKENRKFSKENGV